MGDKQAVIIGGSGFLGRYVVRELARAGWRIRVVCRRPNAALQLKTAGEPGQIALSRGDLAKPESVTRYFKDADAVVNLVGILFESGSQKFNALQTLGAQSVAATVARLGGKSLVHLSALGVNKATTSRYAQNKLAGEQAVKSAFPEAMILRPSVIFGPGDGFLCRFGELARFLPVLPLVGGGRTRFQPVYAADVARTVRVCLETPAARGKIFELGGPDICTLKAVLEMILQETGRSAPLLNIPFPIAAAMAPFLQFAPGPLKLTPDQVRLLHVDNVVDANMHTLASLGIMPTALDLVAPEILARFRRPGFVESYSA